jgi:hypothetical protein
MPVGLLIVSGHSIRIRRERLPDSSRSGRLGLAIPAGFIFTLVLFYSGG